MGSSNRREPREGVGLLAERQLGRADGEGQRGRDFVAQVVHAGLRRDEAGLRRRVGGERTWNIGVDLRFERWHLLAHRRTNHLALPPLALGTGTGGWEALTRGLEALDLRTTEGSLGAEALAEQLRQ